MSESITVHEMDDIVYTMNGYGVVRVFGVQEDGSLAEIKPDGTVVA